MKANRPQIERALRDADSAIRLFLLYGPDEAGSRALVRLLSKNLGEGAERVSMSGAELKGDPARLADEAASTSLFGDKRYILVEPAGDESLAAVEALLSAPAAGNPVLLIGGALKATSKLVKLAFADKQALAFGSYVPEGRDADRMISDIGRTLGLELDPQVARRLGDAAGGNRAIVEQELTKLALYLDAAPDRPQRLEQSALDAVGAGNEEGELGRMVDAVGGGDPATLASELLRLSTHGIDGITLLRAVARRLSLLIRLRAEVDAGRSPDAVMASHGKAVFWQEKAAVTAQLGRWRADLLAKGLARLLEAERRIKSPGALGPIAVDEELFAIARQAARLR